MKALASWQPWASLIAAGALPVEFRPYDYRTHQRHIEGQRIVIFAGGRFVRPAEVMDLLLELSRNEGALIREKAEPILERLAQARRCQGVLPLSVGLCTVTLGTPHRLNRLFKVPGTNHVRTGMWAWPMLDPVAFVEPLPARGERGFFQWTERVELAA